MFAHLLGIANKVSKQFKKLYPDFNNIPEMDVDMANTISDNMIRELFRGTKSGRDAARNSSGSDSRSGGGGSSFSSGGSSSGGSSGGGFR